MEQYVRKHYPKFKIISSATSQKSLSISFLKKRIAEVDLLVLPPEYNDKYELMSKLGVDKIEVLINERCVPNCPNRQAHYAAISRSQLSRDPGFQENCYRSHCPVYHASMEDRQVETMELSDRKISALQKLGVHNFKFAGRQLYRDRFIREVDSILVKQKYRPYTLHEAG